MKDVAVKLVGQATADAQLEAARMLMLGGGASMVYHFMGDDDIARIMKHPMVSVASDAGVLERGAGVPHPRGYGNNARVLGEYVRERKVISLEEAVRKMTSLPAAHFGFAGRGVIREGAAADLVVFDPVRIRDTADVRQAACLPGRHSTRDGRAGPSSSATGRRPARAPARCYAGRSAEGTNLAGDRADCHHVRGRIARGKGFVRRLRYQLVVGPRPLGLAFGGPPRSLQLLHSFPGGIGGNRRAHCRQCPFPIHPRLHDTPIVLIFNTASAVPDERGRNERPSSGGREGAAVTGRSGRAIMTLC